MSDTPTPFFREVVRVRTSAYPVKRGLSARRDLTIMRRLSGPGACLLETDIDAVGADETTARIVNFWAVPDGLYFLSTCNETRDWEPGEIDDYDLLLTPYQIP